MLTCIIKFSRIPVTETAIDLIFMIEADYWDLIIYVLFMIQFCRKHGKRFIISFLRIEIRILFDEIHRVLRDFRSGSGIDLHCEHSILAALNGHGGFTCEAVAADLIRALYKERICNFQYRAMDSVPAFLCRTAGNGEIIDINGITE